MQSGLINKVAATPANVDDAKGLRHICPDQDAVYADKGYRTAPAQQEIKRKGCHSAAITAFLVDIESRGITFRV